MTIHHHAEAGVPIEEPPFSPRLAFDLESDGLLNELTKLHCLVIRDADTGDLLLSARDAAGFAVGIRMLKQAELVIGHNVLDFDLRALAKLYPGFSIPLDRVRDTLVLCRLGYPEVKFADFERGWHLLERGDPRKVLIGRHSLSAWGYRLGNYKGDYSGGWAAWSREMQEYCEQDVAVTCTLWRNLLDLKLSDRSVTLEHECAAMCIEMEETGFPFDVRGASELYSELVQRREALTRELRVLFPPWVEDLGLFEPKASNSKRGVLKGAPFHKVEIVDFNPKSRDHIALCLRKKYGWEPTEYTDTGEPVVDDEVLEGLSFPEAKLLREAFLVQKRIGQVAEGNQGWLKVEREGRVHGRINTNGAVTGRATHMSPNIAQVPKVKTAKN